MSHPSGMAGSFTITHFLAHGVLFSLDSYALVGDPAFVTVIHAKNITLFSSYLAI
jgi:hypothetical protein